MTSAELLAVPWAEARSDAVGCGPQLAFTCLECSGMFLLRDGLVSLMELYSGLGRRSTVLAPEDLVRRSGYLPLCGLPIVVPR